MMHRNFCLWSWHHILLGNEFIWLHIILKLFMFWDQIHSVFRNLNYRKQEWNTIDLKTGFQVWLIRSILGNVIRHLVSLRFRMWREETGWCLCMKGVLIDRSLRCWWWEQCIVLFRGVLVLFKLLFWRFQWWSCRRYRLVLWFSWSWLFVRCRDYPLPIFT